MSDKSHFFVKGHLEHLVRQHKIKKELPHSVIRAALTRCCIKLTSRQVHKGLCSTILTQMNLFIYLNSRKIIRLNLLPAYLWSKACSQAWPFLLCIAKPHFFPFLLWRNGGTSHGGVIGDTFFFFFGQVEFMRGLLVVCDFHYSFMSCSQPRDLVAHEFQSVKIGQQNHYEWFPTMLAPSLQGWKTTSTFVLQSNPAKQSCPQYKVLVRVTKQTEGFVWVLPCCHWCQVTHLWCLQLCLCICLNPRWEVDHQHKSWRLMPFHVLSCSK